LTQTWFVLPCGWSVIGQWGGREGPTSHERHTICPGKRARKWCCGLIAAALDKPPVQVLSAVIGSLGPPQPLVGPARTTGDWRRAESPLGEWTLELETISGCTCLFGKSRRGLFCRALAYCRDFVCLGILSTVFPIPPCILCHGEGQDKASANSTYQQTLSLNASHPASRSPMLKRQTVISMLQT
jgi:hypothetical protein